MSCICSAPHTHHRHKDTHIHRHAHIGAHTHSLTCTHTQASHSQNDKERISEILNAGAKKIKWNFAERQKQWYVFNSNLFFYVTFINAESRKKWGWENGTSTFGRIDGFFFFFFAVILCIQVWCRLILDNQAADYEYLQRLRELDTL